MHCACIFDLDGTLVNSLPAISHFADQTLVQFGLPPVADMNKYKYFVGEGPTLLIQRALEEVGEKRPEVVDQILKAYLKYYEKHASERTELYPGIKEMLSEFNQRGIPIAVLTNKPHTISVLLIRELFADVIFSKVLGLQDSFPRKPDPAGLLYLMEQLNTTAKEVVYVGDSDVDMLTGKKAGCYTVGVLWGYRKAYELTKAGADQLIERPDQLLTLF